MSKVVLFDFDNTIGYFTCYRQLLSRCFEEKDRDFKYDNYFENLQTNGITVLRPHIVNFIKKITDEKQNLDIDKICIFSRNESSTIFKWFLNYMFKTHNIKFDYLFQKNNEYTKIEYHSVDSVEMVKKELKDFSILTEKYKDGYERKQLEGFNILFGRKQIIFYDDDTSHIMKRENDVLVEVHKFWPYISQRQEIIKLTNIWLVGEKEIKVKNTKCSEKEADFNNTIMRLPVPVDTWETHDELLSHIISSGDRKISKKILDFDIGVRVIAIGRSSTGAYKIGDTGVIVDFNPYGHPNIKWDKDQGIRTARKEKVQAIQDVQEIIANQSPHYVEVQEIDKDVEMDIDKITDSEINDLKKVVNELKSRIEILEESKKDLEIKVESLSQINLMKVQTEKSEEAVEPAVAEAKGSEGGSSDVVIGGFKKKKYKKTNKKNRKRRYKKTSKR